MDALSPSDLHRVFTSVMPLCPSGRPAAAQPRWLCQVQMTSNSEMKLIGGFHTTAILVIFSPT